MKAKTFIYVRVYILRENLCVMCVYIYMCVYTHILLEYLIYAIHLCVSIYVHINICLYISMQHCFHTRIYITHIM